jgi:16S rRNA processing protein RimM
VRSAPSGTLDGELRFGVLGRSHGFSGELILRPYNAGCLRLDRLPLPLAVTMGQPGEPAPLAIVSARKFSDGFLVKLEGIASRESAAQLAGRELRISRAALPPLGEGEFYVEDLVGCVVNDIHGNVLGTVMGLFWNGAHAVLSLSDNERLIPVVPEFIVAVDVSKRVVTVNPHE